MIVFRLALFAITVSAIAQSFDSAEIVLSPPATNQTMTGGLAVAGRYDLHHATMLDLIRTAWNIDANAVIGGPAWLESDRFEVSAKYSPPATPDAVQSMLQNLLKDRFHLKIRDDRRPLPVLALTAAKHTQLKQADSEDGDCAQTQISAVIAGEVRKAAVVCHSVTMAAFASRLKTIGGSYISYPVIDRTGLTGAWDFQLSWTAQQLLGIAGADGLTLSDAIGKQLGLKLESVTETMPVVIVESVDRIPTGVTATAKALPAEFEVAEIKPSEPGTQERSQFLPGGRIDFRAVTLKTLIQLAWEMNSDDELVGLPKEMDEQRFSILAKAPGDTRAADKSNGPPIDIAALRVMLRALLIDRFRMKTHDEERPVTAYALLAEKPKLTKADPEGRTSCKRALGNAPTGETHISTWSLTCKNTTMAQLAVELQQNTMADVMHPVFDGTGIEGAWDFALTWTPRNIAPKNQARADGSASDPIGDLTLEQALEKQLGLKLDLTKHAAQALVIDHIEPQPTNN
jgi:uncharacterized protein (TIGR03435 family)